jgi:hypothetical protein
MSSPLAAHLATLPPGLVQDKDAVERLLIKEWHGLSGSDDGGMQSRKLNGRTESMEWNPPVLTFTIERHGGTVNGSSRAELQRWRVDTAERSAKIASSGRRQLRPAAKRLDVRPLAEAVAKAILNSSESELVKKLPDGRIRVLIRTVIPDSEFEQTTAGRRKRFRKILEPLLTAAGWVSAGVNTYQRQDS